MTGKCKGPWAPTVNSWQHTTIYDATGPICHLDLEDWGVTEDNQDALEKVQAEVAHLIAAAPDLYEALVAANSVLTAAADELKLHQNGVLLTIRAALTKATGEKT